MSNIEVGDRITISYADNYGVRVVTAVGVEKLLYEVRDIKERMIILTECTAMISACKKVESFFEVGRTYTEWTEDLLGTYDRHRVVEIREFDGRKWAVSEAVATNGFKSLVTLGQGDFQSMIEVPGE